MIESINQVTLTGLSYLLKRRLMTSGLVDRKFIDSTILATSTLFEIERNKSMGTGIEIEYVSYRL